MKQNPFFSVVIPTYNSADFLRCAINSVLKQTFSDYEIIVVDNHSLDHTDQVVASYTDPRIRYLKIHNQGVIAASRNLGIRESYGEWVAFLDADDSWQPQKLARCFQECNEETDIVRHRLLIMRDGQEWKETKTKATGTIDYEELLYGGNCLATSAVLVRKKCLLAIGGFCEKSEFVTVEDYDLWLRLAKMKCKIRLLDDMLGEYYWNENSASKNVERNLKAELAVLHAQFGDGNCTLFRVRKRIAMAYYSAARACQHAGRYREAMHWYITSINVFPLFIRSYAGMGQAVLSILSK